MKNFDSCFIKSMNQFMRIKCDSFTNNDNIFRPVLPGTISYCQSQTASKHLHSYPS